MTKRPPQVSAPQLLRLLAERHAEDVFVAECKDGPTWYGSHLRMDAWAMKRSWSKPWTYGYEIKVERSDFMRDEKWEDYLPLCNYFSFVCPMKLIDPSELPAGIGLFWVASTGSRLYQKKKPARRDVEIPETLFRYILMCRARIVDDSRPRQSNAEYWAEWLATRDSNRELGYRVSRKIQELVQAERDKARIAEAKVKGYAYAEEFLAELGVDITKPLDKWAIKGELQEILGQDPRLEIDLRGLADRLQMMADRVGKKIADQWEAPDGDLPTSGASS